MAIDASALERDQFELGDGEEGRVYYSEDGEFWGPSVTEVLNVREDAEKTENIEGWRDYFDGSKEWKSPHHKDQLLYKQKRGTLAHWTVLSQLGHDLPKTAEEDDAEEVLKNWAEHRPRDEDGNILSKGDEHLHDGSDPWEQCMRDLNYFVGEFSSIFEEKGLTNDSILDVERYVLNDGHYSYCGQFDLLYEDSEGDTVLCDLKCSSGIRIDYKLQGAAYAHALDIDVDKIEIIRIYPNKEEVDVTDNTEWKRTVDGLTHEFLGLVEKTHVHRFDGWEFPSNDQ